MLSSFRQKKASIEVARRRNQEKTYTEPLLQKDGPKKSQEELDDIKKFLFDFYKTIYKRRPELNVILEQHPKTVGAYYEKLVPAQVTFEDFWQRYFFRCDETRVVREFEKQFEVARQARTEALSGGVESMKNLFQTTPTEPSAVAGEGTVKESATGKKQGDSNAPSQATNNSGKQKTGDEEITFEKPDKANLKTVTPVKSKRVTEAATIPSGTAGTPPRSPKSRIWVRGRKVSSPSSSPTTPKPSAKSDKGESPPDNKSVSMSTKPVSDKTRSIELKPKEKEQEIASDEIQSEAPKRKLSGVNITLLLFSSFVLLLAVVVGSRPGVLISMRDSLCAPAMPGRSLSGSQENLSLDAPWWVPSQGKAKVFSIVCRNDHVRTRLEWTLTGLAKERDSDEVMAIHRLTLYALVDDNESRTPAAVRYFEKQHLLLAKVNSERIELQDRRGPSQNVVWPWTKARLMESK